MKYFLDTEFVEETQTIRRFGFKTITKPTIDLISIGIVTEDGREYYAISKDFNLKEAWNRYQIEELYGDARSMYPDGRKNYWIRDNVLKPIYIELKAEELFSKSISMPMLTSKKNHIEYNKALIKGRECFTYKECKRLINKYGKSNKQIAEEVKQFIKSETSTRIGNSNIASKLTQESIDNIKRGYLKPEFYGYYADYDWVVFCWLFGKMIDLPTGFPMYCIDLKQMMDEVLLAAPKELFRKLECDTCKHNVLEYLEHTGEAYTLKFRLDLIKEKHPNYPKQINEHNALFDAKWNRDLYNFLIKL